MPLNVGCSARPGNARDNKTGSWRTFRPEFDNDKCNTCGTCMMICPEVCIGEDEEGYPDVDYDFCKGCGLCAEECPKEAIKMKKEEK
ncbi:pyruvate ferredoxin/flavodoxin oxidoreductase, delta subunit [Methanolacinia petrolearia DSM 11571]|uniref:Pyruvate synthase subunit PorD n=1 Tax=Methanolacinia petrolearia (strain DSM 11571 / OCM 486 / SEBR 4847) TaxID=679926 RepID=E1RG93_METP4|nr:pyruvate synthase subunit PorD [Methanolacinia petrolearia]ADN37407.1 pyruvate ferredoxin/flavodoxin oxidoreductase, delta subunit [Methanolacinia petrolearia DSM 11571]